jgi:hypothetical protein
MKLSTKQKVAIGVGVALVIGGIYVVYNRNQKAKEIKALNDILDAKVVDPNKPTGQVIIGNTELSKLPIGQYPLKFGSRSQKVFELQRALNQKYGTSIDLDGKFGQSTASALCKHYFKTCFTDVQSRLYEITNEDLSKIKKPNN